MARNAKALVRGKDEQLRNQLDVFPPFALVVWADHTSIGGSEWVDIEDIMFTANAGDPLFYTLGWIVDETEDYYLLVGTIEVEKTVCHMMRILKSCVKLFQVLPISSVLPTRQVANLQAVVSADVAQQSLPSGNSLMARLSAWRQAKDNGPQTKSTGKSTRRKKSGGRNDSVSSRRRSRTSTSIR